MHAPAVEGEYILVVTSPCTKLMNNESKTSESTAPAVPHFQRQRVIKVFLSASSLNNMKYTFFLSLLGFAKVMLIMMTEGIREQHLKTNIKWPAEVYNARSLHLGNGVANMSFASNLF